jgi:hypothetical protein
LHGGGAGHRAEYFADAGLQQVEVGFGAQCLGGFEDAEQVDGLAGDAAATPGVDGLPAGVLRSLHGRAHQARILLVEAACLGDRAPGGVAVSCLDEQRLRAVLQAVGEVEQPGPFGDQRPVPWSGMAGDFVQGGVVRAVRGPGVADRPGPFGVEEQ